MKITIWGARGSIPSPLKPEEVKEKIYKAVLGAANVNLKDPQAVRLYVDSLPALQNGTAGGNTTCVEIQANNQTFIIDAGSGIRELGLKLMEGPCGRGKGVLHLLFSHAHWDHIQGFPFFRPAFVPGNKIYIYSIHDLETVLAEQQKFITFPVPLHYMQATREFIDIKPSEQFYIDDVKINTIETVHPGKAYAFRFDDEYSTFVFASDAEYKNLDQEHLQPYIDFFRNADALIFDTQFTLGEALEKVDWGHSSALIGADMARAAGAKKLLLFHHDPTYSDVTLEEIQESTINYQAQNPAAGPICDVVVAHEGLTIDLAPSGALTVELIAENEAAVLTPTTIFDEHGVGRVELQLERLQQLNASGSGSVIDLSQVETLTTASLKALMSLRRDHMKASIVLASPSPHVKRIIELAGFLDFFAIYPSVDEAVEALKAKESLKLPGQMLKGRYQIENKLHDGRLGVLLLATDLQSQQKVAIKVLSASFSEKSITRFLHQAEQLVNFKHVNMIDVLDYDKTDESAFIVEEYAPCQTLHQVLRNASMSAQEALDIGLQIARVLEYVHSRGKIHGDLQPKNVMMVNTQPTTGQIDVTEQNDSVGWVVKVKRFGMGWLEEGVALLEIPLSLLSAPYLAPEQILGHPLDARTDLYALGVILYQLFAGQLPFVEEDDQATMRAHLHKTPQPLRESNPRLSNALEHFILKLLAKNPNERYANAQQAYHILKSLVVYKDSVQDTPITPQHQRMLVGRHTQLNGLLAAWQKTQQGQGQLFFITGETGIGKTRLIQELATQAQNGVVLTGYCEEWEGAPAYHPFIEILQTYFSTVPPEVINQQDTKMLSEMTRLVPDISHLLPNLAEIKILEPKQEHLRVMNTLTQFVTQATKVRPWLIILEDLHWIDNSSLQALNHLARFCTSFGLMIVCTYRDTDLKINHPLLDALRSLSRQPSYQTLPLERLNENEVGQMLGSILTQSVYIAVDLEQITQLNEIIPHTLINRIYQRTEGNPVYVEELVNGLIDTGVIKYEKEGWQFTTPDKITLPQTMRDAVMNRIKSLNHDTQQLLHQAAVLGRTFNFEDLQIISGLSEWEVLERLDVALERQLIHEVYGEASLTFNHTEIHQVLYEDMSPLRCRAIHLQAGKAIEDRTSAEPALAVEQLAYHYGKAGKFEKAIIYAANAAYQAKTTFANQTALHWYHRVLSMAKQLEANKNTDFQPYALVAHENSGKILITTGRYDEALEHFSAAQTIVRAEADSDEKSRRLADLSWKVARIYKKQGDFETALSTVNQGLTHLNQNENCIELAMVYLIGSEIHNHQANYQTSISWSEKGLEVAIKLPNEAGQRAIAHAYYLLGASYRCLGQLEQATDFCQQSLERYQQLEDIEGLSRACINLGKVYIDQSKWNEAYQILQKSLSIKEEIGDLSDQGRASSCLAKIELYRGNYNTSDQLYHESLAMWQEVGSAALEAEELNNLAHLALAQHNWSEAENYLNQSEMALAKVSSDKLLPDIQRCWAKFYLSTGQTEKALNQIKQAIDQYIRRKEILKQGASQRILGQIYQATADYQLAEQAFQDSLELLSTLPNDYETAKTKLALVKFNNGTDNRAILSQAIKTFERLEAKVDLSVALSLVQK
ncbi:tetratricopeptide repeat protein [Anaerolineales bacterium HSG24]|nr:tetratricopeptide repeat protein [Anaerolineales bacterium HSG24]